MGSHLSHWSWLPALPEEQDATDGRFQTKGQLGPEKPAVKTAAPGRPLAVGPPRPPRAEDKTHQLSVLPCLPRWPLLRCRDRGSPGDLLSRRKVSRWPHGQRPVLLASKREEPRLWVKEHLGIFFSQQIKVRLPPDSLWSDSGTKPLFPSLHRDTRHTDFGTRMSRSGSAVFSSSSCPCSLLCKTGRILIAT